MQGKQNKQTPNARTELFVDLKRPNQLVEHRVEVARLHAGVGLPDVAVHGVALPHDLDAGGLYMCDQRRQQLVDG